MEKTQVELNGSGVWIYPDWTLTVLVQDGPIYDGLVSGLTADAIAQIKTLTLTYVSADTNSVLLQGTLPAPLPGA